MSNLLFFTIWFTPWFIGSLTACYIAGKDTSEFINENLMEIILGLLGWPVTIPIAGLIFLFVIMIRLGERTTRRNNQRTLENLIDKE